MKLLFWVFLFAPSVAAFHASAQNSIPCSKPEFRQFDFWIGKWEVFGVKGTKAGDSKITVILDSCVILEEWTSAGAQQVLIYTGKSFNSYNSAIKHGQIIPATLLNF
jgi:hypothetical protein